MSHAYTEDQLVERPAVQLFAELGWETVSASEEVFGAGGTLGRETKGETVLVPRLRKALERLNPALPPEAITVAVDELARDRSAMSLVAANREVYALLKDGVKVSVPDREQGGQKIARVRVVDWENPSANDFLLVSQMSITGTLYTRRPDLVGFINGLPMVVVEFKKPGVPARAAFDDNLTCYKADIPQLFWSNALMMASNGTESRVGSITADWERFFEWKRIEREGEPRRISMEVVIRGTCAPGCLLATHKLEQLPQWVKVTDVFKNDSDAPFLKRAGIAGFEDSRYEKYSQRLARLRSIRKYVYRMDVLERKLSYDEVTEIFVRVNSLGAKLRSSDLALAQITAKWRGSLKTFQGFQTECAKTGFDLDLGLHLKNLVAFATGQSRFLTVANLPAEPLKQAWKECVIGMEFALNFLKSNVGIDSPALLSSPFMLVTLGYFGHKRDYQITAEEAERLRFWVLVANAKGRYSRGSSETLLDQDLAILRQDGGANELIDRLRQQVGRLSIVPEELEGRNQRSALFKTMFLAFQAAGAKDWRSNLAIALDHSGTQHRLQFHHTFPKAVLKSAYTSREADDIANLAFIGGKTNRSISDKPPAEYFPALLQKAGQAAFDSQCIPTHPDLLRVEGYKEFLAERRKEISRRLNEFLGTGTDPSLPSPVPAQNSDPRNATK